MKAPAPPSSSHALGEDLARKDYLRVRQQPRWRDEDYLQLKDLRDWIAACATEMSGQVFD